MLGGVIAVARSLVFGPPGPNSPIHADGTFTIGGLTPGDYTVQVTGSPADQESASADITVEGGDITGVRLIGVKPSSASGRLVVPDQPATAPLRISVLRVAAAPDPIGGIIFGPLPPPAAVHEDGTFELKLRPGSRRLTVGGLPSGWALKTVRQRGVDVTDGLEVRPNEEVTDLELELTNQISAISGLVTDGRGESVKDYTAIVFARDPEKWRPPSRYVRSGRPDQDGRFKVTAILPGEYLAIALDAVDPGEATDPEFLDRIQRLATKVSIGEGETKVLDLKMTALP
jgi:hypothetical protein